MHPYGKLPQPQGTSNATSPPLPTATPASGPPPNPLRPSYGLVTDRDRDRERQRNPYSYPSSLQRPDPPSSSSSSHSHQQRHQHHHHHHHHPSGASSAGSTPRDERTNPYAPPPPGASAGRKPDMLGVGLGAGLGRLSGGYGLFGNSPFREQEMRDRERQERIQRERERDLKPPVPTSPTQRASISTTPGNSYPRPSLPPSPTNTIRGGLPASNTVTSKPSISPQLPPASAGSASASAARPSLPLPNFSSLGSRSLPSPFERDTRERSASGSAHPSPAVPTTQEVPPAVGGHARSLSNSSAREIPGLSGNDRSPPKPSAPSTARSLYAGGPPPLSGSQGSRDREVQRSPVTRAPTAASPREPSRDNISPPVAASTAKPPSSQAPPASGSLSGAPTSGRGPYTSSYTYPSNPAYAGSFGGFGLSSFGGYGAFGGPRWDHEREREAREARDARERVEREGKRDEEDKRKKEIERQREKEREEREREKWKAVREQDQRERERRSSLSTPSAAPGSSVATARPPDPYRRNTGSFEGKPSSGYTRHIEVLNHPDPSAQPAAASQNATNPAYERETSVIQQVAPTREPRPYGYKPEPVARETPPVQPPIREPAVSQMPRESLSSTAGREPRPEREYYQTVPPSAPVIPPIPVNAPVQPPREKRSRMDAVVEDAQVAHQAQQAQRRSSQAKSKRRKLEEEKMTQAHHGMGHSHASYGNHNVHGRHSPVMDKRDFASLAQLPQKRVEVSSAPVEAWLKGLPSLSRVIGTIDYSGKPFTLVKTGLVKPENEGGLIIVRIGGGFLGRGWRVRGEPGWEDASTKQVGNVVCGAQDPERACWGTDVYTDDSDLGLILVHAGWIRWSALPSLRSPQDRKKDEQEFINVTVRLVPRLVRYIGTERNGLKTRGWGNGHDGSSVVVERVERVKIDRKYLASRKRKARISEWVHQRALVCPIPSSKQEDEKMKETILLTTTVPTESLILSAINVSGKDVTVTGAFKYSPDVLKGWLDVPIEGDELDKSLWGYKLILEGSGETYQISMNKESTYKYPLINLTQLLPSDTGPKEIFASHPASGIYLWDGGFAAQIQGEKGILFKVEKFKWEKLKEGEVGAWAKEVEEVVPAVEEIADDVPVEEEGESAPQGDHEMAVDIAEVNGANGINGHVHMKEEQMDVDG
ncbi:hypothetical protein, variant [Cryptococcus neoformans var. grubii H99]|uniref:Uncharacterized protein n=1 Tax=Cryptococcus neoformans (strain H99 / ATCC 208821 / CBS 10515 / FGSC 9487) TaxID=235443 RepID=T2BPP0_CRYN9|nr:hypothetical protein, variant [Cryptococcus neoformans var. grubii H99]AGV14647.1 hypothetical protein, variant [Cryptococcus neoformans var. grubii H99]AUB27451.1 hypothetical protein CKF44_04786 [Cryptococcus neoformans var. grubii]|eukprot:XP_012052205.1 hypothetical protein, variant [Cryptococcus neoformans var. grubii H99]